MVGVYVAVLEDGKTPCLKVMLARTSAETERALPKTLEGYPVVSEVTGEIRPLGESVAFVSSIFVTGGTGYIGSRLIPLLTGREHDVKAVVRPGSVGKLPGVVEVVADPLQEGSYTDAVRGCDTFVHLIGVPHPSPAKAAQFRTD